MPMRSPVSRSAQLNGPQSLAILLGPPCQDDGLRAGFNTSATMTRNVDDKGY